MHSSCMILTTPMFLGVKVFWSMYSSRLDPPPNPQPQSLFPFFKDLPDSPMPALLSAQQRSLRVSYILFFFTASSLTLTSKYLQYLLMHHKVRSLLECYRLLGKKFEAWREYKLAILLAERESNEGILASCKVVLTSIHCFVKLLHFTPTHSDSET